jgi:nucleotide-binding universal stress UspA family protein
MVAERKKILVPVDFEGVSKRAVETAKWLAGPLGADLCLLHVHDRPGFSHPELPAEMIRRIEGLVEQAAAKSLADLAAEAGATETVMRHGDVAEQILAVAAQLQPAMVVMGTHGRAGLDRLFLGSVAANVVRACPCPLVTVRANGDAEN